MIADNKRIKGEQGITNGFQRALSQGCKAVIIDLDSSLKSLNVKKASQHIDWRKADFAMGKIKSCYVVFNNKAIVIDRLLSRDEIKEVLKKLKS